MTDEVRKVVIGDVLRDGRRLWLYCETCAHSTLRDPAELARHVGYDFPVPGLKARLRCSACGGRTVDVRVHYPTPGVITRHGPGE
jgi:hypothetical protein